MKDRQAILEKGTYKELLLNLCLPTIVIMLVMVIYNMADTFFIGQLGDPDQLAAVSLCIPIFTILSGLGTLFGNGGCTLISLSLGKGEQEKIKSISSFCFLGSVFVGILFMAVVLIQAEPLSRLLGSDADTLEYAKDYFRIIAIGAPVVMFNGTFCNIIRADGAAVASMVCNLIGTILNIVLDAVFILVLGFGVEGAAAATVIGNLASCLFLACYLKKNKMYTLSPKYFLEEKKIALQVLAMGLPLAGSTLVMSVSNMVSNHMMIQYGSAALAAQGVAGKLGMLISMLAMGICMGLQPAISYAHGQENRERIRKLIKSTISFTFVVGVLLAVCGCVFRTSIIHAFIQNDEVMAYGQVMILGALIVGPIAGWYQLTQTYLQATEKPGYATFVAVLDKGLFYLPVLFFMARWFGAYGIAFAAPVTSIFSLIVGAVLSIKWYRSVYEKDFSLPRGF